VKISAIICTRNRSSWLPGAIRSLADQTITRDQYEIIVVDNASTDATKPIVRELMSEFPNLRYVYASEPGLANARNNGLTEAAAPVVAFLDDDAIADRNWLTAILEAFGSKEQPACVGGPVEPWWEIPQPTWFPASFAGCHHRFYGETPRLYRYPAEQPIGCNMAFLKVRLTQLGGFNPQLQKYNDETELIGRLVREGGKLFYQPRARVQHLFGKERVHLGWQMKRYYQEGKSLAGLSALNGHVPRNQRFHELSRNFMTIGKRSARLFISIAPVRDRVQRLADLSLLVGKAVYLTKSLREI
jgi:glycosyltransferase involved in cell wall biosynthesis